jgi:hypothetical protein
MDLVVTVLVALIAGVIGGIVPTRLRIAHERAAEIRKRQLEAGDDFVESARVAVRATWTVEAAIKLDAYDGVKSETTNDRVKEMLRAGADTQSRLPRIRFLFGPDSDAARSAADLSQALSVERERLWSRTLSGGDADEEPAPRTPLDDLIDQFSRAARREMIGRDTI